MKYLYRILACAAILLPLLAPVTCAAQKKARTKLRALAVVELPASARVGPDMQMPSTARLLAVTIFTNGEYQDASIYEVNPMPMALEPGIVYDVQQSGESLGLFTIESAGKAKDDWLASGKWKSEAGITAAKHAPAPGPTPIQASDERPHLKRGGNQSAASQPTPAPTPSPAPASTSAQPAPAPTHAPAEATQPAQESTAASPSTAEADPSEADPNRPALRHRTDASAASTPPTQVERKREAARVPVSARVPLKGSAQSATLNLPTPVLKRRPQAAPQFLVAISDATPYETHSYKFPWTADEQQQLTSAVQKQALAEMTAYAAKSARMVVPGSFVPSVQAFDLYSDNNPEMVVTAKCALRKKLAPAKAAPLNAYITYVVGQEPSGDYSKLLSDITDDDHMDINGRLELVDAVDTDGDGRAELLFRRVGVTTQRFELYRAGRDQLRKLFDGAEIQKN